MAYRRNTGCFSFFGTILLLSIYINILTFLLWGFVVLCENNDMFRKKRSNGLIKSGAFLGNAGCTGSTERNIINGEHFLKIEDSILNRTKEMKRSDSTNIYSNNNNNTNTNNTDDDGDDNNNNNNSYILENETYVTLKQHFPSFNRNNIFVIYLLKINKDLRKIIRNDFYKVLFDCAETSSGRPFLVNMCVKKYFRKHRITFSSTCLSCFSDFIGCNFISCNRECSHNQCGKTCRSCSEHNCFHQLLKCTQLDKLPDPCEENET